MTMIVIAATTISIDTRIAYPAITLIVIHNHATDTTIVKYLNVETHMYKGKEQENKDENSASNKSCMINQRDENRNNDHQ